MTDINLCRLRLLNALGCPPAVIQIETAIASYMGDRESARIGLELLGDLLGHSGDHKRKFAKRRLDEDQAWQSRANVRTFKVKRGERNIRRVTQFSANALNQAALWIVQQLKIDGRPTLARIDELVESAIAQFLRQPLTAVKAPRSKTQSILHKDERDPEVSVPLSAATLAALNLAQQGRRMFPLDGQVPRVWRWVQAATTSEPLIRKWADRWPDTAWAILCGVLLPEGGFLTALDLDRHSEKFGDGFKTLALREEDLGPLPKTFNVKTRRDGEHRYFRTKQPVPTSQGVLGPALDIKGTFGFVVAPGAPGYEVIEDREIAWLPEAWEEALAINRTPKKKITEGERHDYLRGVAFAMACQRKTINEIVATLRHRLSFNCEQGGRLITDRELEELASSAVAKIARANQMLEAIVA